jgi:hypothetical protein
MMKAFKGAYANKQWSAVPCGLYCRELGYLWDAARTAKKSKLGLIEGVPDKTDRQTPYKGGCPVRPLDRGNTPGGQK